MEAFKKQLNARYDKRGRRNRHRRYLSRWNKMKLKGIRRDNERIKRMQALQQRLRQVYGI